MHCAGTVSSVKVCFASIELLQTPFLANALQNFYVIVQLILSQGFFKIPGELVSFSNVTIVDEDIEESNIQSY